MKYCLFVSKDLVESEYLNKADELMIRYDKNDPTLPEFLDLYKEKRIVINISFLNEPDKTQKAIKHLAAIRDKFDLHNIVLGLYKEEYEYIKDTIKESGFPFFFFNIVNNWDTLRYYIYFGVTDLYIGEQLGFELKQVAEVAQKTGQKVRVYPNVFQTGSHWENFATDEVELYKGFFIRPEDVPAYEEYVDIMEFYGDPKKQTTYFDIYNQGYWFGPLNEIIIGYKGTLDNRQITPEIAGKRSRCGRRCFKGEKCNSCTVAIHLANTLKDKSLIFN
jgi:hypothetical protein